MVIFFSESSFANFSHAHAPYVEHFLEPTIEIANSSDLQRVPL